MFRYLRYLALTLAVLVGSTPVAAIELENLSVNGYFSMEYERNVHETDDHGKKTQGDTNGSFDIDLIDLVFNFQATDDLRIAADLTWEHGVASEDGRGNAAVEYAFAEYRLSPVTKVRTGKMFTNFGIYNEIHTAKPATLTVKEPLATNKNNKLGSDLRFYPRWLTGVAVLGNYTLPDYAWDYVLQISNGETEDDTNPFEEDTNVHKAVNGRARIRPTDELQFGASFYTDKLENLTSGEKVDIKSLGVQAEWENEAGLGAELEYVKGDENYTGGTHTAREAYTGMVFYRASNRTTPFLRYEHLDPNKHVNKDQASIVILGVNILVDDNMYLKVEGDHFSTEVNNADYSDKSFTEFKVSLSIGF